MNLVIIADNGASVEGDISLETEEAEPLQYFHIEHVINYTLNKLMSGEPQPEDSVCNLRVFYPICQHLIINHVHDILTKLTESIPMTYTLVPVIQLHNINTVLSFCAVRHN